MTVPSPSTSDGIQLTDVTHAYGDELVLDHITLSLPAGSFTAILGPSGCGKTTLLRCAAGLISPTSGRIALNDISPAEARHRGDVGFAFQSPTLLPWRTAVENVLLPLELLQGAQASAKRSRARELLATVDMYDEADKYPRELSGGMQQRAGLARALVTEPSFLFLDEPFGALDGMTRDRLNEKVRRLWKQHALTMLVVTHSIEEAVFLANTILVISHGPARIASVLPIGLPQDRDYTIRMQDEFFDYVRTVRQLTEAK